MTNPYAEQQLARALRTGASQEDEETRLRADQRALGWIRVLEGIASGSLRVGSRAPVRDLPAWVTLEVLRGGFATGRAKAGGPLSADERQRADRLGLEPNRAALFGSWLTDDGLAELSELLGSGAYRIGQPENAALLIVSWLVANGDRAAALELLDVIGPYADRLRFSPVIDQGRGPVGQVWRRTAGEAQELLAAKRTPRTISAEREALGIWIPLIDRFLTLWWATRDDSGDLGSVWTAENAETAAQLASAYDQALVQHRLCRKYRDPKENLPILVDLTRARLTGPLSQAQRRRVTSVVDAMVTKRGAPGGSALAALRSTQARTLAAPLHRELAQVVAQRCATLPPDRGIDEIEAVLGTITRPEAERFGVPVGTSPPASVTRTVRAAASGTVEELIETGVITSAEVLAELIPALTAEQIGTGYRDPALGRVVAATYEAFRSRRSLLLLDLAEQVQFGELPWVRAVQPHALVTQPEGPLRVARRVAALALDAFPATILPNPLIAELTTLSTVGGESWPLTEELAADIFMGRFSDKFRLAAQVAAAELADSIYARYYGIDYLEVLALDPTPRQGPFAEIVGRITRQPTAESFGDLCSRAVPPGNRWSVARNGMIIERQQQLTTHNLAVLVLRGKVNPSRPWFDLAVAAAERAGELLHLARRQSRPLPTVKDAAYAWRQALFFLTLAGADRTAELVATIASTGVDDWPMRAVLDGLSDVADGAEFDEEGRSPRGRRLTGWTMTSHWALSRP